MHAPSATMAENGNGGAIYDKFKRDLRKYERFECYIGVVDIHFHANVAAFIPQQRMWRPDFTAEDLLLRTSAGGIEAGAECEAQNLYVDFDTPVEGSWTALYKDAAKRTLLSMLYVVFGGKAIVDLIWLESGMNERGCRSSASTAVEGAGCSVYLHGVGRTITDAARDTKLENLRFSRIGTSILVSKRGGSDDLLIETPRFLESSQSYAPSCCWIISKEGLRRFVSGDCRHAETQTRIVLAVLTVTEPTFRKFPIEEAHRNILVIAKSKSLDCPLFAATVERLRTVALIHRIKETTVVVPKLLAAIRKAQVSPRHLCILYAMGGCGALPAPGLVSSNHYFQAYMKHKSVIGGLGDEEEGFD